jgi:predicted nucleotidyltransferase
MRRYGALSRARYTRRVDAIEAVREVLEARADVRLAYLFGSVARGEARASSDFDIGVVFAPVPAPAEIDRLASDLEAAARRRVDLVVLNDAPPLLGQEAIRTGRLILCRDEDERVRFQTRATARYLDTAHLRRVQYAYLRERAEARHARPA